jgi:hypothetical protein
MASVVGDSARATTRRSRSSVWAGYAAAAWAILFAIRGAYWALGGTVGLGTLSEGIRQARAERDPWLFAGLWITVGLEVVAALLALALVRPRSPVIPRRLPILGGKAVPAGLLLLLAWGAGTVLAGHGGLFVGFGLVTALRDEPLSAELRWYALFWGPWFLLGGLLFLAAGRSFLRRAGSRRPDVLASAAGALGGLLVTAAPFVVSALAA